MSLEPKPVDASAKQAADAKASLLLRKAESSYAFPVLDSVDGANGSQWVSEAIVTNPKPWFVENFNSVIPVVCIVSPCGERLSPRQYSSFLGEFHPHGVALVASRVEAPDLGFSLRVRDRSREAEGFGTEVPVVREKNMFRDSTITLLGVPGDPRRSGGRPAVAGRPTVPPPARGRGADAAGRSGDGPVVDHGPARRGALAEAGAGADHAGARGVVAGGAPPDG